MPHQVEMQVCIMMHTLAQYKQWLEKGDVDEQTMDKVARGLRVISQTQETILEQLRCSQSLLDLTTVSADSV